MIGWLALGLIAGCSLFLSGCSAQEEKNTEASTGGWEPQPDEETEKKVMDELDSQEPPDEPVVRGAEVLCTNGRDEKDVLSLMGNQEPAVEMDGIPEMVETDILLSNDNKFQYCRYLKGKCPGAEIEGECWKFCDPVNDQGETKHILNRDESIMLCLRGLGIIYLLGSGQTLGEMENKKTKLLLDVFDSWWNGKFMFRDEIEPIVNYLNEKNLMEEYKSYQISKEEFLAMGFNKAQAGDFSMIDMNRVLNKYDITTTERLRHFFAQCYAETGNTSGILIETGGEKYLQGKSYYPYYGAGHIQLTNKYSYQAFATYIALQKYPQLEDSVHYKPPAHNDPATIQKQYDNLKEEAKKLGIDIAEIIKIVEPPEDAAKYVAENYEWETAGYFWDSGGANEIADTLTPGDATEADKITEVVNPGEQNKKKRRDAYKNNVMGVIQ